MAFIAFKIVGKECTLSMSGFLALPESIVNAIDYENRARGIRVFIKK